METNTPKIIYDFNPNNIPSEYLQAIGLVTAASSQTESILQEFIGALLNIDNIQTLALTTHLTNPQKDDIIRALAEMSAPTIQELDKIDELLDAVKNAFGKRNTIVHNAFIINPENGEVLSHRIKARGSLQLELQPISVEEIKKEAASIYKVGMDIAHFMISRNLTPNIRTQPLRQAPKRGKQARQERLVKS